VIESERAELVRCRKENTDLKMHLASLENVLLRLERGQIGSEANEALALGVQIIKTDWPFYAATAECLESDSSRCKTHAECYCRFCLHNSFHSSSSKKARYCECPDNRRRGQLLRECFVASRRCTSEFRVAFLYHVNDCADAEALINGLVTILS
jgi:hypothetical protein